MAKITTFDDWTDYFRQWQKDIGLDTSKFHDYKFEVKFGAVPSETIEFGDYAGRQKWETVLQIPDQRVRDTLLHLITYQGDTEFASVEQQRNLLNTAPTDYDLQSAVKIMREEMRHGTQMSYLLVKYFGSSGKLEAQKLLERRAFNNSRLLGAFNQDVEDWLDFYCYTELVDRDGKYQLTMLNHSGFKPLAASMTPMLQEEFYHLLTGHTGLTRVIKGDQYTLLREGKEVFKGTIKVDPSKSPKAIDAKQVSSDKAALGIYQLDGDTQKICLASPGRARPTEFSSEQGSGQTLTVWKRKK